MRSSRTLCAAGISALLTLGGAGVALAADMLGALPPPPPMMPPPAMEASGGFYLRGDVGIGLYTAQDVHLRPAIAGTTTLSSSLNSTAFIGIGAGYQFNSFLRTDVTVEHRFASKFKITEQTTTAPATPLNPGYNVTRGKVSANVLLANAYVDLGTWHRITPYFGAGIGVAGLTTSSVTDSGFGAFAGGFGSAANKTTYNLAWAIHAGATYDLSANIKADVGYRYLNMGTVNSGTVVCTVPCAPFHAQIAKLDSHDVRIGLRYVFADMAPMLPPGPLVRKY